MYLWLITTRFLTEEDNAHYVIAPNTKAAINEVIQDEGMDASIDVIVEKLCEVSEIKNYANLSSVS